jgi:hypothetical protein
MVTCDTCRATFDEAGADYVVHFDTEDDAIRYITEHGWQLTDTGDPICFRCAATALCARDGHQYSEWTPCACHGAIPDHALFGCGLFRICWRDGCEHYETRTLAQLPTTQEPTTPGC